MRCAPARRLAQQRADFYQMKKEIKKELLDLLKRVLPKVTHDAQLTGKIYDAIKLELKAHARVTAFEKFCTVVELPDLEAKSIAEVKQQLTASFGDGDITIRPNQKEKSLTVEVSLTDGSQFTGEIKVNPNAGKAESEEQEITLKFVPFPVSMPGDKELVWLLAKRENLSGDEAGIALSKLEEEFWASKTGQKLIRDRVERSFPEFIARAPAGMFNEMGLKRHYKTPEAVKATRSAPKR